MITWLPALLRIVGRIINGIMNVNAIKEMCIRDRIKTGDFKNAVL